MFGLYKVMKILKEISSILDSQVKVNEGLIEGLQTQSNINKELFQRIDRLMVRVNKKNGV